MVMPQPANPQPVLSPEELDRFAVIVKAAIADYESKLADTPEFEEVGTLVYSRALEDMFHALERIESGLYGICEECGDAIAVERLEALPHTTRCTGCPAPSRGR